MYMYIVLVYVYVYMYMHMYMYVYIDTHIDDLELEGLAAAKRVAKLESPVILV